MADLKIFDEQETASNLPFDELVCALEQGFTDGCQFPERHHHTMKRTGEPDATLLLMPAWTNPEEKEQYLGVKLVNVVPGNTDRDLPALISTYILYDGITGEQLVVMDGNTITCRRTVATSALAAKYLARPQSSKLLVVGAGRVASLLAEAYKTVLPIEKVAIWDINLDAAERLAGSLRGKGFKAHVAIDLASEVQNADIISAATLSTSPLIKGAWIKPGTHVDLIGAFTPEMREADDELIQKARIFIDTWEALHEAGDLVQPIRASLISRDTVQATLAKLSKVKSYARLEDQEITLFKAVGSGLADLVAAKLAYKNS